MKNRRTFLKMSTYPAAMLLGCAGTGLGANLVDIPDVKGDGEHDDTQGIQALLDSSATVFLPKPEKCYLISKTLKIHSGQTLVVDRNAVIRLKDGAGAHLLTNSDHTGGNSRITVIGGIWDGNNLTQMTAYHEDRNNKDLPYDPDRYLGVLMLFDNVKDLYISDVTFKDPRTFAFLAGRLNQFTIEKITFDFNLKSNNQDGIHIAGNCHHGRIADLKGATNDDLVALNADDAPLFEVSSGPITDIQVDGIWGENVYRAVRLLSCKSPIKRIKISNIYGTCRNEAVILSNIPYPDGCPDSRFEDISISGIFSANARSGMTLPHIRIRIRSPAYVSNLSISDYHRTESKSATDGILVDRGARVDCLTLSNVSLFNQCSDKIALVNNRGEVGALFLSNVFLQSDEPELVQLLDNSGEIKLMGKTNVSVNGRVGEE